MSDDCQCCGAAEGGCDCAPSGWPVGCGRCPHYEVEDGARWCARPRPGQWTGDLPGWGPATVHLTPTNMATGRGPWARLDDGRVLSGGEIGHHLPEGHPVRAWLKADRARTRRSVVAEPCTLAEYSRRTIP